MGAFAGLGSNILADLLFALGFGGFSYAIIRVAEHGFLDFFGVRESRTMVVYLSNLWDRSKGKPKSAIVSGHEFRVARSAGGLFDNASLRLPDVVKALVDTATAGRRVALSVEISPNDREGIVFSNMIVVGSTTKNTVRQHYFGRGLPWLTLCGEAAEPSPDIHESPIKPRVHVTQGPDAGCVIDQDYNYGIVEKLRDPEHNDCTVFLCAGMRGDSSWAATEYLVRHPRKLAWKYGNKPFALCLGFPQSEEYMETYVEPALVAGYSA